MERLEVDGADVPNGSLQQVEILIARGRLARRCFELSGDLSHLQTAIDLFSQVLPFSGAKEADVAHNLATTYLLRINKTSMNVAEFDQGITLLRRAIALTPAGEPSRLPRLAILGTSLTDRFKRSGDAKDLDEAITFLREAVATTPLDDRDRPSRVANLGLALKSRFERLGNIEDIHESITFTSEAISCSPEHDSFKATRLSNLGVALGWRFLRLGTVEDIDDAVTAHRNAVSLTLKAHPSRAARLSNLGSALARRFERLSNVQDIDEAIGAHGEALKLVPEGHPHRPTVLNNYATSLSHRSEHFGNLATHAGDVEDSIDLLRDAIEITPDSDPDKPMRLTNLGGALLLRFDRQGSDEDLDEAIAVRKTAVNLTPTDHPDRPARLNNLSDALRARFNVFGDPWDIGGALEAIHEAMYLCPADHREQTVYGISMGHAYLCRLQCNESEGVADSEAAISAYRSAALLPTGNPFLRLDACRHWGRRAFLQSQSCADVFEAYQVLIELIPLVAWLGGTISERHKALKEISSDVRNAAAMAIMEGKLEKALEWLEEGRSVVWGQQLNLRTPFDELQNQHPQLAERVRRIGSQLDARSTRTPPKSSDGSLSSDGLVSLEQAAQDHRRLAEEWKEVVEDVRQIPEFEDFLRPRRLAALRKAAHSGPVVVLNVWGPNCDAIILQESGRILHVPLNDVSEKLVQNLHKKLSGFLRGAGLLVRGSKAQYGRGRSGKMDGVLSVLWKLIIQPILQAIDLPVILSESEPHPRLTWCATGALAFLPLHAAGDYQCTDPGHKIFDFVTSSYTSSLSALLPGSTPSDDHFHGLLAISQPATPYQSPLPSTTTELAVIQTHLQDRPIKCLADADATIEAVQDGMNTSSWLHLACHAIQNRNDPMKSAFCLHDGYLELGEIVRRSHPYAEFAFLSACQTSSGNEELSDEAVHLAAGMQLAGYRSVIATMWSIKDSDAPVIADEVYHELVVSHGRPDYSLAADALRRAVGKMREEARPANGALEDSWFLRWVPFIHFGI
ncbi:CHAT domain-containing protein [Rhodocollybia butyracea]|uniref:CHAT domain-containing protein n=1 Tax=Rhodocollybia butyracea TaxID=206335 RepID=A0A9P5Q9F0_9AGAR|nr:CHAT domain-containing protein [Rhodocollybia butyracea]